MNERKESKMDRIWVSGLLMVVILLITACSQAAEQKTAEMPVAEAVAAAATPEGQGRDDTEMVTQPAAEATMQPEPTMPGDEDMTTAKEPDDEMGQTEPTAEATMEPEPSMPTDEEMAAPAEHDAEMGQTELKASEAESGDATMGSEQAMQLPDWYQSELMDVNSGTSFTLDMYRGKVILVETIAVWCPNCLRQQREIQALHELLGMRDDLISIALDIDPNETAEILRTHAMSNGFDWIYAVAPRNVAREIGQRYGNQFLNPPSTPVLIIDRHGEAHPLPFGIKRAGELQEALQPFLDESM
jgi:hypothetical protein